MDINSQDIYGQTELMNAIINNNIYLINSFFEKNADVNIQSYNGDCALFLLFDKFAKDRDPELIKKILPKITDINCIDYSGNTILHKLLALYKENYNTPSITKQDFKSPIVLKKQEEDYWLDKNNFFKETSILKNPSYDIRDIGDIELTKQVSQSLCPTRVIDSHDLRGLPEETNWEEYEPDNIDNDINIIDGWEKYEPDNIDNVFNYEFLDDNKSINIKQKEIENKRKEEASTFNLIHSFNNGNYKILPSNILDLSLSNQNGRGTPDTCNFNDIKNQFPYDTETPSLFKSKPSTNISENLEKRFFNEANDIKERLTKFSDIIYDIIAQVMENQNINFNIYNSNNKNIYDMLCDTNSAKLLKLFSSYPNIDANYLIFNIVEQMRITPPNKELCSMFMQLIDLKNIDTYLVLKRAVYTNNIFIVNKLVKNNRHDLAECIDYAHKCNFLQCEELLKKYNIKLVTEEPNYLFINGVL